MIATEHKGVQIRVLDRGEKPTPWVPYKPSAHYVLVYGGSVAQGSAPIVIGTSPSEEGGVALARHWIDKRTAGTESLRGKPTVIVRRKGGTQ